MLTPIVAGLSGTGVNAILAILLKNPVFLVSTRVFTSASRVKLVREGVFQQNLLDTLKRHEGGYLIAVTQHRSVSLSAMPYLGISAVSVPLRPRPPSSLYLHLATPSSPNLPANSKVPLAPPPLALPMPLICVFRSVLIWPV